MANERTAGASEAPNGPTTVAGLLTQQLGTVYAVVAANTGGMSHAESLAQPRPSGNCANWILAHLVDVHNALMAILGETPVWEHDQLKRETLFDPIEGDGQAFDWETMRGRFAESRERCLAATSKLSADALAQPMTGPFGEPTTLAGLLGTIAVHQTYHAGQLAVARRIAGLEGAVRGPGQDG